MANGLINTVFFLLNQYLTGDYWGLTVLGTGRPHFPDVVSRHLSDLGRFQPLLPGPLGPPWPPAGLLSGLLLMRQSPLHSLWPFLLEALQTGPWAQGPLPKCPCHAPCLEENLYTSPPHLYPDG